MTHRLSGGPAKELTLPAQEKGCQPAPGSALMWHPVHTGSGMAPRGWPLCSWNIVRGGGVGLGMLRVAPAHLPLGVQDKDRGCVISRTGLHLPQDCAWPLVCLPPCSPSLLKGPGETACDAVPLCPVTAEEPYMGARGVFTTTSSRPWLPSCGL